MHPKIKHKIRQMLTRNEEIEYYIGQNQTIFNWIPDYVIVTNRRLIVYRNELFGAKFSDLLWIDLQDVHFEEHWLSSTFRITNMQGNHCIVDTLPKDAAARLYAITQELEESARIKRREHKLEEKRAGANSTVINNASIAPKQLEPRVLKPAALPAHEISSTQKLKDLKDMFNEDLISDHEYEVKRIQILKDL